MTDVGLPLAGRARRWATLQEAAAYVGCHPKTLTRRFGDGTLVRYRMGRRILVDLDELDAVMEATAYRAPGHRWNDKRPAPSSRWANSEPLGLQA